MSEKPILFSAEMVRAILDSRKTQTRRLVKGLPSNAVLVGEDTSKIDGPALLFSYCFDELRSAEGKHGCCYYGKRRDRLWVRESWATSHKFDSYKPIPKNAPIYYHADNENISGLIKRPSIFMPKWASRITLEITDDIRVERLQSISKDDVIKEGCYPSTSYPASTQSAVNVYRALWQRINGSESWDANPYVYVIEFKLV